MNELLVTALSGLLTLIGVCVTAWASAKKTRDQVADRLRVALVGTVRNNGTYDEFTIDANGTTTLTQFITTVKGWTIA